MKTFVLLLAPLLFIYATPAFTDSQTNAGTITAEDRERMKPVEVSGETLYENDTSKTIATPEGHLFRIAKDRPIEKVGGLVAPVEMDSYIYKKFEELDGYLNQRFGLLDLHLSAVEKKLSDLKTTLEKKTEENQING